MKESIKVLARDGLQLAATRFIAETPHDKVVLINSATGVKQEFYHEFASYLASKGFTTYTYDYRGIGQSRPEDLTDLLSDMKDWAKDVDALIAYVSRLHTGSKLILAGHSVGGQLIGMSRLARQADAVILIGSQTPYWKNYDGLWMRLKLAFFWYITIPLLTKVAGYFPASKLGLFEDLPAEVALQWSRWAKNKEYIFDEHPEERFSFNALNQRALMISFSDDHLAPIRAVLDLKRFYKNLRVDHWHFQPEDVLQKRVGHFGFFKKRMAPILWRATLSWLYKTVEPQNKKAA